MASVWKRTRLGHPHGARCAVTPPRGMTQLPQVKLRLPELDVNGRFDQRDELRFRKGHTERAQQRAEDGAVTRRLESLGQQHARLGAILPHCCALLSFGCRHAKPSLSTPWTPGVTLQEHASLDYP